MPNKLTDSEIVKALECCKYEYDTKCELCCYNFYSRTGCRAELRRNALDLINRLQAENGRQKSDNKQHKSVINNLRQELKDLRAKCKSEHLKFLIYEKKVEELSEILSDTIRIRQTEIKAEAYKEFAERLKKALYSDSCRLVFDSDLDIFECAIDNLLKELVGEDK